MFCSLGQTQLIFFVKSYYKRVKAELLLNLHFYITFYASSSATSHHHRHSSATSHRSISETDSQLDEFHSLLFAPTLLSAPTTSSPPPPLPPPSTPSTTSNLRQISSFRYRQCRAVGQISIACRNLQPVPLIAFSVMVSDKTQGWSGDVFSVMEYNSVLISFCELLTDIDF
ncbi:hypothetical protein Hanom_Chr09g00846541 [Helianthus anomalus]